MARSATPSKPRGKRETNPSDVSGDAGHSGGNGAAGGGSDSPSDRLSTLLEQFGGGGGDFRAYVERLTQGSEPEYLGPIAFDENFYDAVRNQFGGGRFAARIVEGSKYRGRVPPFKIAGKPRDPISDEPPRVAASEPQPSKLDQLAEGLAKLSAAVAELRDPRPPAVNPVTQAVELIRAVREMTPPPPAPAPPTDTATMIDTMNAVLEMQERLGKRSPPAGSGVADAIRELAPIFTKAIEGNGQPQPPEPMPVNRNEGTRIADAPPAITVAGWIKPFLGFRRQLLLLADAGRDPALYAALFNDNIDDATAALLVAAINADTVTTDLFAAFPELNHSAERRVFAGKLVESLKGLFEDDDAPAPAASEATS